MLGYDTLANHYRTNFVLMQDYKYPLDTLDNMMPWEKQIYLDMINNRAKILEDQKRNQADLARAQKTQWVRNSR